MFLAEEVKELLSPYYEKTSFPRGEDAAYRRWYVVRELRVEQITFHVFDNLCCYIGHPELFQLLEEV